MISIFRPIRIPRANALARSVLAIGIACSVVSSGCDTSSGTSDVSTDARRYDGAEIFDGLFFGVGPIGALLGDVMGEMPADERARMDAALAEQGIGPEELEAIAANNTTNEAIGRIHGFIEERDPTFFTRFADSMQSGDPFEVDAALDEALDNLTWARAALDDNTVDSLSAAPRPQGCGIGLACVVVVAVAVVNAAAVVNGAAIWNGFWFWSGAPAGGTNELARDRIVDLLTTRLAAE